MDFSPMATTNSTLGGLINEFFGNTRSIMTPFYSFGTSFPSIMPVTGPSPCESGTCENGAEIPQDAGDDIKKRRELGALKYQLEAAIEEENFEKAIELRDKIKKLEQ